MLTTPTYQPGATMQTHRPTLRSLAADLACAILIAIPLAYLAWVALGGHQ